MTKQELARLVREYGDAIITYRSENSNKQKYNVCTLDFSTPYIQQKINRVTETDTTLMFFAWDTDSFRLITPSKVVSVIPLATVLKNDAI